jgi:NADH:ubiquinone oxidoreductase subunit 2 (subunit N)
LDFGAVWPEIILAGVGMLLVLLDPFVGAKRQRALGYLAVGGIVAAGIATLFEPRTG